MQVLENLFYIVLAEYISKCKRLNVRFILYIIITEFIYMLKKSKTLGRYSVKNRTKSKKVVSKIKKDSFIV